MFLMHFCVFFHQFPTIFCTFTQILCVLLRASAQLCTLPASSFSVHLHKLFLHIARNCTCEAHSFAQTFSSLPPHFFQLVRNFMTICFQLPCKTSQLPSAFSYATTAFSLHFVSVSTAFSIRNVYASTMFLACIAYASTMFLTHNIYLSITKYL